jgi:hypothetical protein
MAGTFPGQLAVGVDDERRTRVEELEEAHLGLEIVLRRRVVFEVLVGNQVGEQPEAEVQAVDAALAERMRGDLHGDMAHALVGEPAQGFLQHAGVGGGDAGLLGGLGELDAERAHDAHRLVVGFENVAQQQRGRRLAQRAGDADQLKLVGRVVVKRRGQLRQRGARVGNRH